MGHYLIGIIDNFGYIGVAFLIAIENIFPPIPSEVILTFAGFMTTTTTMKVIPTIIYATFGSMIGSFLLYKIASLITNEHLYCFCDHSLGKLLGFQKEKIDKTLYWFHTKGKYATLIGRFIPIIRSLISIPAGMSKMNFIIFSFYTFIGSIIWNSTLILVGYTLGEKWNEAALLINEYSHLLLLLLTIVFIIICAKKKKAS